MYMWRLRGGDKLFGPLSTIDLSRKEKLTMTKNEMQAKVMLHMDREGELHGATEVEKDFDQALVHLIFSNFYTDGEVDVQKLEEYLQDTTHMVRVAIWDTDI